MERPWHSLPTEIWVAVFGRLSYRKDLAQCRLVCKRWDPLAEKALFSRRFYLRDNDGNRKIHYHLSKKPFLARYIKELYISGLYYASIDLVSKEFFKLAITPEIELLNGSRIKQEFFEILLQIIQNSPVQFSKIKCIPSPIKQSDIYLDLNYMLRNSITSIEFNNTVDNQRLDFFLRHLHEFKKVDSIVSSLRVSNFRELDDILKQLPSLEYLTACVQLEDQFVPKSKYEMNEWLMQNVEKKEHLEMLQIHRLRGRSFERNLMEYLVYKYTKIETLMLRWISINLKLEDVLLAVKDIPVIEITDSSCFKAEDMWMLGYHLKSSKNTIEMRYSSYHSETDTGTEPEINKWSDGTTDFTISLQPYMQHSFFKQLLSSVCTGQSDITELNVDLVHGKNPAKEFETLLTFYDILEWIPRVEKLFFSAEKIEYQEEVPDKLVLHELKKLNLMGIKIEDGVITQLGELAPNLENLTLSSCLLLSDDGKYNNRMDIIMPDTTLKKLRIRTHDHIYDDPDNEINSRPEVKALLGIEDTLNVDNNIYIHVNTPNAPEQYFLLPLYEKAIILLSKEEFEKHSPGAINIYIECKALSKLDIRLVRSSETLEWEDEKLLPHSLLVYSENLRLKMELSAMQQYLTSNGLYMPANQDMEVDET